MSELYTPAAVAPPQAADAAGAGLGLTDSIYNRLLKERIIWLGSEVRDDNANAICAQMLLLAAEDPERDIYLYINSPGGSVTAGMAIYDTMQYVQPDVATVATGLAASMGQHVTGLRHGTGLAGDGLEVGTGRGHVSCLRSACRSPGWSARCGRRSRTPGPPGPRTSGHGRSRQ